jgi:hypothetical protein
VPTGIREFLSETNRRAIGKNLARVYPVDNGLAFPDLLIRIGAAERRLKTRRS